MTLTGTGTATTVEMNFEKDVVKLCARTTTLLDNPHNTEELRRELSSCAPSLIASKTAGGEIGKVVLKVRAGNPLWSSELESSVRRELSAHRSMHGPVQLDVQRYS